MFLQTTGMEELHSLLRETENIESHLRLLCEEGETAMEAIEPSELTRSLERKDAAVRTAISEGARIDCEVYEERHLRRLQWSKALHLEYILVSFLKPGTIEDGINNMSEREVLRVCDEFSSKAKEVILKAWTRLKESKNEVQSVQNCRSEESTGYFSLPIQFRLVSLVLMHEIAHCRKYLGYPGQH